jgi:hypothetical protein
VRLHRRCGNPELVDTAIQDTFLAVWKQADRYQPTGEVGAWLWTIAIRRLIDQLRKRPPPAPLAGVALAFGPKVDPTHEVALAAPIDGFRLFLVRALTVVGASTLVLLLASLLVPTGGAHRVAWLLPSLAATSVTMALATRFDPRLAAGGVAVAWIAVVTISVAAVDAAATFGPTMQVLSLFATAAGAVGFTRRRRRLDAISDR